MTNSADVNHPISNTPYFQEVERWLRKGKMVTIRVQGGSMRPFLQDGDKVLLIPAVPEELSRGHIVLAHTVYGVLLHRIVRMRKEEIWLAGDANAKRLEYCTKEGIIGVVGKAWRKGEIVHINSSSQRAFAFLWYLIRPFRGYLLGVYYRLKRIKKE